LLHASTSRDRIFLIVFWLVICPLKSIIHDQIDEATSIAIAAMKLDDDFKNNTSKHAQLLFATAYDTLNNRGSAVF
jgi:hypothetical protein